MCPRSSNVNIKMLSTLCATLTLLNIINLRLHSSQGLLTDEVFCNSLHFNTLCCLQLSFWQPTDSRLNWHNFMIYVSLVAAFCSLISVSMSNGTFKKYVFLTEHAVLLKFIS